jgi:glycine/D-amino acid oxidase-like deaminating enzyme
MRVVVVGAGIVGAALAAELAGRDGVHVTVVDGGERATGTSATSMAWLNANDKPPRAYHELNVAGMRAYAALASPGAGVFSAGSAVPAGWYHPVGNLRCTGREHVRRLRSWGYAAEWVSRERAAELEPALRLPDDVPGLGWFPDEGYVDTADVVELLLERARRRGAQVRLGPRALVTGFEGAGSRVRAVRQAGGDPVPADLVVCCAGWRTPQVAGLAGVRVPLESAEVDSPAPVVVAYAQLPPGGPALRRLVHTPLLNARPHPGGRLYLEAEDLCGGVDVHMGEARRRELGLELLRRAREVLPGVAAGASLAEVRVCVRPLPVDGYPVVGPTGVDGFHVVVTHSGVTLGLRLAELVAAEVADGGDVPELAPYRLNRFIA